MAAAAAIIIASRNEFYQQNAAMNATNTGLANTSPPGPRRILIIDDNPDAAEMLASILELHGQRCMTAHGGLDGLAAVAQFQPEIIFLDIGMPVINGYQVAASLRANREIEQPFIIAFTAWSDQTTRRPCSGPGKPVSICTSLKPPPSRS